MIWLWVMLAALLTIAGIFWLGKLPAAVRPLAGAAVMLGLAGYALQGSPSLPGKPVASAAEPEGFGDVLTDQRQGMADRFGPAAQWLGLSDGFARTGKTQLAAQTLEKGLEKYPDNVDLWVGLGNALTAHGGGMMSPAAALAFDEAARRDPTHPAPPFFAGLALAQGGDLRVPRQVGPVTRAQSGRCAMAARPRNAAGAAPPGAGATAAAQRGTSPLIWTLFQWRRLV